LKVLLRPAHDLPLFSIRWVGWGGQRLESPRHAGLGALWARCVCDGVVLKNGQILAREELNERIDASSASLSSFHGRNSFGFQLDGLSEDLDSLFALLAASIEAPLFEEKVLKQEIVHQIQDIKTQKQNPGFLVGHYFNECMFPNHAYGRSSLGEEKVIKSFKTSHLKAYHKTLCAQPQVLSVCGDVTPEQLEGLLKKYFTGRKFAKLTSQKRAKAPKYPRSKKELFHKLNKEQMHLLWGFPTCTIYDKDRWALLALSSILSGQGGRLFVELRDKLSLCYTVAPTHMEGIDGGYFAFYIATSPEKTKIALDGMKQELMKIINDGVSADEWKKAHTFITGNHQLSQQSLGSQSMGMALDELYGLGYDEYFHFDRALSKVTPADIQRVTQKYLHPQKCKSQVLSMVGPTKP
jgi:zinc protease